MARKTKAEAEQTRRDILEAALELFHAKGYTRTTLEEIARSAGVTRGAIYWHFKDKVDLFNGLKDEIECSTETRLEDLLLVSVNELSDFRDNILRLYRNLENDEHFKKFFELIFLRAEFTEELQPVLNQFKIKLHRLQQKDTDDFSRLQQAGKISANQDCVQCAFALRCLIIGSLNSWLIEEGTFSIVERGGALIDHFLNSLR
ncbi:transcriptional regulator, TetR family [Syntrophotalea carbinolica DSM 2380]|uniref:Transcriptional regulator, TetR family n=1 Tax=Syntrophotalea carbinolica (strain DSM 2380 / NBRC 103641 / GraBd1) TaxID=338963 RepID=Q39ZX6_SYNC1|nr:TetR family transcriptional regulator [Syntrophotalea carbinolica]ABA90331.1 transcriptional regulator, TetR family [Syntrophotalea carbinolica DSM 2380]